MSVRKKNIGISTAATTAAIYVILTFLSSTVGLSAGPVQFRLSEMLCLIPAETVYGIPGITCGCLFANLLTGSPPIDIILGTAATLIGSIFSHFFGKRSIILASLPPILSNSLIVPLVLRWGYGVTVGYPLLVLFIGLGESAVCLTLGQLLIKKIVKPLKKKGYFPLH